MPLLSATALQRAHLLSIAASASWQFFCLAVTLMLLSSEWSRPSDGRRGIKTKAVSRIQRGCRAHTGVCDGRFQKGPAGRLPPLERRGRTFPRVARKEIHREPSARSHSLAFNSSLRGIFYPDTYVDGRIEPPMLLVRQSSREVTVSPSCAGPLDPAVYDNQGVDSRSIEEKVVLPFPRGRRWRISNPPCYCFCAGHQNS